MNNILLKIKSSYLLYLIIDTNSIRHISLENVCLDFIEGGADIIQYRDKSSSNEDFYKNASLIYAITKDSGIPLILNDRIDIALDIGVDGVHLGQSDLSISVAQRKAKNRLFVGCSVHNLTEFQNSKNADYFGIGCVFPSKTKKNVEICGVNFIKAVRNKTKKPIIAIGGINLKTYKDTLKAGADGIALISPIFSSKDISAKVKEFSKPLHKIKKRVI